MDCKKAQLLLHAYVDGELDLSGSLELEAHLAGCPACRTLRDRLDGLGRQLRAGLERPAAPAELRQRLGEALAAASAPPVAARPATATRAQQWRPRQLMALAASVLVAVMLSGGATYWNMRSPEGEPVAEEVVASHIRSLMADHLIDVASSDQHTVKPWFDGKLDLAPAVVDLSAQGFPLVGGRLDYIGQQPVAAIVYRRGKHVINLFAWPRAETGEAGAAPPPQAIHGYNILSWNLGDMAYWAVSDVNPKDLLTLRRLIEQGSGATPD
jgi:anti-sigma factor RsiW